MPPASPSFQAAWHQNAATALRSAARRRSPPPTPPSTMAPRPLWTRPSPRLRNFTPSTRHGRRPEYTSRRGAPGALQSGRATRRARNCASRGRSAWCRRRRWRMPRRRSQLLFLSGVLFVASLAGSRLAGGRPCGWTRPPGDGRYVGIPITVRGGRPPLGSWASSNPHSTARIYSTRTAGKRKGLFPAPPHRGRDSQGRDPAALPRRTLASPQVLLAWASSRSSFDLAGKISVGSSCMANWMHFYSSLGRILRLFLGPWLIGVQSAGAAMRDSEPEMNFTKQPRVQSISHWNVPSFLCIVWGRRKMLVAIRKPDGPCWSVDHPRELVSFRLSERLRPPKLQCQTTIIVKDHRTSDGAQLVGGLFAESEPS